MDNSQSPPDLENFQKGIFSAYPQLTRASNLVNQVDPWLIQMLTTLERQLSEIQKMAKWNNSLLWKIKDGDDVKPETGEEF